MKEKRKFQRYDLKLSSCIYYQNNGQKTHFETKTRNISSGGAFFYSNYPLEVGTRVEVELFLPIKNMHPDNKYSDSVVISSSFVVRTEENGMAVCFDLSYTISPMFSAS